MPLTATHPTAGVLDATLADLGCPVRWEDIHRPKVPAGLECRGCGKGVHAKASSQGLRFFAHNRLEAGCPLNGETPAHRLLKSLLAAALRSAGWHAELEVPGDGWRADVLGTSPDGKRRIAWEAQLASTTAAELMTRTSTMLAELDGVCWVTDKDVPWVGRVPSVRIRPEGATGELVVAAGVAKFRPDWCERRNHCDSAARHGYNVGNPGPCPGHGTWELPPQLTLDGFVAMVCWARVLVHTVSATLWEPDTRHPGGTTVWTASRYVAQENEQLAAAEVVARRRAEQQATEDKERAAHEQRIAELLARQEALFGPAAELVRVETGLEVRVHTGDREPRWAMGVPVSTDGKPYAVICPVASRIDPRLRRVFADLLLVVADERERKRVAAKCAPGTRIVVIPVDPPAVAPRPTRGGIGVQEAVRRLVWGG